MSEWPFGKDRRESPDEALRQAEQRLRTVLEGMGEAFYVLDRDWRFIFASHSALRRWGKQASEIEGRPFLECFPNAAGSAPYEAHQRVMDTGSPEQLETISPVLERWIEVDINPSPMGGIAVSFRDIHARKISENALRASEERMRLAIAATGLGTFDWDIATDRVVVNARFREIVGLPAGGEVIASAMMDGVVHPDDRDWVGARIAAAMDPSSSGAYEFEHRAATSYGVRWLLTSGQVHFAGEGDSRRAVRIVGNDLDITERKRAEAALAASETRLSAIYAQAAVGLAETDTDGRFIRVNPEYCRIVGRSREELLGGLTMQAITHPDDRPANRDQFINAVKDGAPFEVRKRYIQPDGSEVWVHNSVAPIHGADGRIVSLHAISTDISRAVQAETALRESEERFQQFGNASRSAIWIRDAQTFEFEYASPAVSEIYGVEREAVLRDGRLLNALIVPEERDAIFERVTRVSEGETLVNEYRIRRASDGEFRWIRSIGFPIENSVGKIVRIGGIAEDVTKTKLAVEHQGVLLGELQHRVRNIMAMMRSMAKRSADGADDVPHYRDLLSGRLMSLARVQVLLTRAANAGGSMRDIIETEVSAQADQAGQYELIGPEISLSPRAVEVLSLVFHELATNALKYGALSSAGGRVTVRWEVVERRDTPWLSLDWLEEGAPARAPSSRRGFGTELIEGKVPYELGGTARMSIEQTGAHCHLEFPLKSGESIFETDAPAPTIVFGGALDMRDAPDLTGQNVLVVEDDYYIAADTASALRGAGAAVVGPCPTEEATRRVLEIERPTAAVVDLNLGGGGPRFQIAHLLNSMGVPFIFLTGYDPDVIPDDLATVVRLQKPAELRDVIQAVSEL